MSSRTYPLSRQRRRPGGQPLVPVDGGEKLAAENPDDVGEVAAEREPARTRTLAGEPADPATLGAGARPAAPRLPHERDENADTPQPPRAPILQAEADILDGQQDTDLRSQAADNFRNAGRRR